MLLSPHHCFVVKQQTSNKTARPNQGLNQLFPQQDPLLQPEIQEQASQKAQVQSCCNCKDSDFSKLFEPLYFSRIEGKLKSLALILSSNTDSFLSSFLNNKTRKRPAIIMYFPIHCAKWSKMGISPIVRGMTYL